MKTNYLMLLLAALFLVACGSGEGAESGIPEGVMSEEMLIEHQRGILQLLEDSIYQDLEFNKRKAKEIYDVYLAYASEHPLDTMTPEFLFRAAQVSTGLKKNEQAIKLYDRLIKNYPGWRKMPQTKFMKGFTYETHMDQRGAAADAYQVLLYDHPNHPLSAQARQLIDNMQYSDEELVKKWKMENEASAQEK